MQSKINSKPYISQLGSAAHTKSTLQIPGHLLGFFQYRCRQFGKRNTYFVHLVKTYALHLTSYGINPVALKWKKQYQNTGLNLERKHFVPDPYYWEVLRHLGFTYGLSMCNFFVVLLELEYKRWHMANCPDNFKDELPSSTPHSILERSSSLEMQRNDGFSSDSHAVHQKFIVLERKIDFLGEGLERTGIVHEY